MLLAGDPPHAWEQLFSASLAPMTAEERAALHDLLGSAEPAVADPAASRSGRAPHRKR